MATNTEAGQSELESRPPDREQKPWIRLQVPSRVKRWISCANCEKLRNELETCKDTLDSALQELNDQPKQIQGDIEDRRSPDSLEHEYQRFFNWDFPVKLTSEEKTDVEDLLCRIFQEVYNTTVTTLLGNGCLQRNMRDLFAVGFIQDPRQMGMLKRSYALLLSSSGLTGNTPIRHETMSLGIEEHSREKLNRSGINLEEFKKGALNLAWGLATTVPPHVPSCEVPEFDERIHDCLPKSSIYDRETACILKYSRPILFANCMGQFVIAKGYVSEVPIEVDKVVSALPQQVSDGVFKKVLQPGSGVKAEVGDTVTLHYTGSLGDGAGNAKKVFASTTYTNQPISFKLGDQKFVEGWNEGCMTMSQGERAILTIASHKGHGEDGYFKRGVRIPPNSELLFEMEILSIEL